MAVINESRGDKSFLANLVKGECLQETPSGNLQTKGNVSSAKYLDAPNSKNTIYHYPQYGTVHEK